MTTENFSFGDGLRDGIKDDIKISTMLKMIAHRTRVAQIMLQLAHELERRAHDHDLSKFFPDEFFGFCELEAKRGGKKEEYGSKSYEAGVKSDVVTLHVERNDHHLDHSPTGLNGMSFCQITEMLCDWEAARQERDTETDMDKTWDTRQNRFGLTDYQTKFLTDLWDAIKIDMDWG